MDKILQTIVIDWIPDKAKVVDFGCGDGALLRILAEEKSILGYGVENDPDEEVVDRWFRELCANVVVDGDYGGPLDTGSLDISSVKRENE